MLTIVAAIMLSVAVLVVDVTIVVGSLMPVVVIVLVLKVSLPWWLTR